MYQVWQRYQLECICGASLNIRVPGCRIGLCRQWYPGAVSCRQWYPGAVSDCGLKNTQRFSKQVITEEFKNFVNNEGKAWKEEKEKDKISLTR